MRILHVIPKINDGGGIGDVFAEVESFRRFGIDASVTAVALESTFSSEWMLRARNLGIRLFVSPRSETLNALIAKSDLVVVSYWNHPLLNAFMLSWPSIGFRTPLILNVKVNGMTLPQVLPEWVVHYASGILHSHPDTLHGFTREALPDFHLFAHPFIQLPDLSENEAGSHGGDFIAFYAGSLNRFKRHPDLFDLHDNLPHPGPRIEYWGAGEDASTVERMGRLRRGVHRGFSRNVFEDFKGRHLLLNPQSPLSYGSYDKTRVECAWMGIPSLVLEDSRVADHVLDGGDGLIAADGREYLEKLEWLARDSKAWRSLSDSTFQRIRETYVPREIAFSLARFYGEVVSAGPRQSVGGGHPASLFDIVLSGMGKWGQAMVANPETLTELELEHALYCEGGWIHHSNMNDYDPAMHSMIDRLKDTLEARRTHRGG